MFTASDDELLKKLAECLALAENSLASKKDDDSAMAFGALLDAQIMLAAYEARRKLRKAQGAAT